MVIGFIDGKNKSHTDLNNRSGSENLCENDYKEIQIETIINKKIIYNNEDVIIDIKNKLLNDTNFNENYKENVIDNDIQKYEPSVNLSYEFATTKSICISL